MIALLICLSFALVHETNDLSVKQFIFMKK
jgi:hypothetical protein